MNAIVLMIWLKRRIVTVALIPVLGPNISLKLSNVDKPRVTYHGCGEKGHHRPNSPQNPHNYKSKQDNRSEKVNFLFQRTLCLKIAFLIVMVDCDKPVRVLDTGCSSVIVND